MTAEFELSGGPNIDEYPYLMAQVGGKGRHPLARGEFDGLVNPRTLPNLMFARSPNSCFFGVLDPRVDLSLHQRDNST